MKRGLINTAGTVYKWLFGLMDEEDRTDISEHLSIIDTNNLNLIKNMNQQIYINSHFNHTIHILADTIMHDRLIINDTMENKMKI